MFLPAQGMMFHGMATPMKYSTIGSPCDHRLPYNINNKILKPEPLVHNRAQHAVKKNKTKNT